MQALLIENKRSNNMNVTLKVRLLCLSLLLVHLIGCNKTGTNPSHVLSNYLNATINQEWEIAYELISEKDRNVKSFDQYYAEQNANENVFSVLLVGQISFEINEVNISGDKAVAMYEITMPDFSSIFMEILGSAFSTAFSDDFDAKKMEKQIAEKYKGKKFPMTTINQSSELILEKNGWRVFFDWEKEIKIENAMSEAKKLEEQKKFHEAKAKYESVLELDSKMVEVPIKINELEKQILSFDEKKAYMDNLELRNVKIGKGGTFGYTDVVLGEIKNQGDKILIKVEITIYGLDSGGKAVFETIDNNILVPKYLYSSDASPLKPNYTRKFESRLDDTPSDWVMKVNVKITDIEFQE